MLKFADLNSSFGFVPTGPGFLFQHLWGRVYGRVPRPDGFQVYRYQSPRPVGRVEGLAGLLLAGLGSSGPRAALVLTFSECHGGRTFGKHCSGGQSRE